MWQTISNESYHNELNTYLSSSDFRRLLRSPAHYRNHQKLDSPALAFGTLVHTFVLEPDVAKARYRARAEVDGRTKEGKAIRELEAKLAADERVEFVSASDYNAATAITDSVYASVGSSGILTSGMAEGTGLTELCGVNVKVRPDYLREDMIIDLKTTQDARPEAFLKSVINFGYEVQAALYVDAAQAIDGLKRRFLWIAAEKEAPYAVSVFEASDEMLERGRRLYKQAIETYTRCVTFDDWPGYTTEIQTLNLPKWLKE